MKEVLDILDFAMTLEQEGQRFFTDAAARVKTPAAREIFGELAKWEEAHWQYLKAQRDSLADTGRWAPADDERWRRENLAWEVFYQRGEGFAAQPETAIGDRTSDLTALRLALFIENDLAAFYQQAIEKIDAPEGKRLFAALSGWETDHRRILQEEYDKLRQDFWSRMGFAPF